MATDTEIKTPDVMEMEKQQLLRDTAKADAIEKRLLAQIKAQAKVRNEAPDGVAVDTRDGESIRDKFVRAHCPEAIDEHGDRSNPTRVTKARTVDIGWAPRRKHEDMLARAWKPWIMDSEHVCDRGDYGYKRNRAIGDAQRAESKEFRDARFTPSTVADSMSDAAAQGGGVLEAPSLEIQPGT